MKLLTIVVSSIFLCLTAAGPAFGQKGCDLNVTGSRYFIVLAGSTGMFYDRSGATFPMLIKMDGKRMQVDAVGIYAVGGKPVFGAVPPESYRDFMREPRQDSGVVLRLEIAESQYERSLKIMEVWKRRAEEGTLLYPDVFMDNILLVKQITENLNQCGEKIKLYRLDWSLEDTISDQNPPSLSPLLYFKELRRLNQSLHLTDEKFPPAAFARRERR